MSSHASGSAPPSAPTPLDATSSSSSAPPIPRSPTSHSPLSGGHPSKGGQPNDVFTREDADAAHDGLPAQSTSESSDLECVLDRPFVITAGYDYRLHSESHVAGKDLPASQAESSPVELGCIAYSIEALLALKTTERCKDDIPSAIDANAPDHVDVPSSGLRPGSRVDVGRQRIRGTAAYHRDVARFPVPGARTLESDGDEADESELDRAIRRALASNPVYDYRLHSESHVAVDYDLPASAPNPASSSHVDTPDDEDDDFEDEYFRQQFMRDVTVGNGDYTDRSESDDSD